MCGRFGRLLESRYGMASPSARALCLLLLTLALCHAPSRTLAASAEASRIVTLLQHVTTLSADASTEANKINVVNVLFEGPKVAENLKIITNTIYNFFNSDTAPNPTTLGDADALLLVGVLVTFVEVQQNLLSVVIGKHGLLSLFFFTEPVRVALVSLEGAIDTLALHLIEVIGPTQEKVAQEKFDSLVVTLTAAINVYSS